MILEQDYAAPVGGAVAQVVHALEPRAAAVLLRVPHIDPRFPDTSDLDFLALADHDSFQSERMRFSTPDGSQVTADVAWIPWSWVADPRLAAMRGWVPHRLLSSEVVFDSGREVARICEQIRQHMYDAPIHCKRIDTFLDIGYQTVREIGITRDFPALSLFWLHMGYAACLGALLDGMRRLCPNVYTRPFDYFQELEWSGWSSDWIEALRLNVDPEELIAALSRIHRAVISRFPEPDWPESIGAGTRYEYRYWLSAEEIAWRIGVAREMVRRGDPAAAVFYLRFCAYAVIRIPMLWARAREGAGDVSFLRPEKAILPELNQLIPEIVPDLTLALSGTPGFSNDAVEHSLSRLCDFRDFTLGCLRQYGAPVPELKTWAPYQPITS